MTGTSQDPLPNRSGLSRRTLLKIGATSALGVAIGAGSAAGIARFLRTAPSPYLFFSASEASLLTAVCEQIIPRDDTPGATDAGVIFYIDRQLFGAHSRHQRTYRRGLESFRNTCLQVCQAPFEKLPFDQQTDVLRLIESGKAPKDLWGSQSQQSFFDLVIDHARQGFYGSPRHGGNRNYVSYQMLGLAYPNLIGQNRYSTSHA